MRKASHELKVSYINGVEKEEFPKKHTSFYDLELHPDIEDGLDSMGFKTPTPIQAEAIPHILDKRDVLGIAQT